MTLAYENCIAEIVKASGGALDDKAAQEVIDEALPAIEKRMRMNPLESRDAAAAAVAKDLATSEKIDAIIEKRQRAINVLTKVARNEVYARNPVNEQKAMDALNVGRTGGGWGAANSVHAKGQSLRATLLGAMMTELNSKGLTALFRSRDFEDSVAAEIWRLTDPDNPNLPAIGSKEAQEAARIIGQATEMGRKMQNGAGAWIGKLPGYVMRQDWDMVKVRYAAGRTAADFLPGAKYDWEKHFQAWSKKFLDRVDHEKTFDDPTDAAGVRKYMEYVFNALASGKHEESKGADDWLIAFKGPGNRAKRISQHRSIHFKGPAEMMASHRDFGHGSLLESVTHGLDKAAQNTALMRTWGTNPEAAFKTDLGQMQQRAVDRGDFKASDKLRGSWSESLFKQVNGTANIGGNPTIAAIGAYTRGWKTLNSLGLVLGSAVTDVPLTASTLRYAGFSYPEAVAHQIAAIGAHLPRQERDQILQQLGVMLEGITSNLGQRFTSEDGAKGALSKTLNAFMGMTGIRWWTDNMKAGVALGASWKMAQLAGHEFADLPELLRANLARYNIGEKEWNLIRQTEAVEMRGNKYLTSDGVHQLSDEQIAGYLGDTQAKPGQIKRAREEIATNLGTYFTDLADEAVNQPGAYERAVTSGGLSTGTVSGEAVRAFMQFKGFGISAARRHFWREISRNDRVNWPGLALLITGTTAMGWAAMEIKNVLSGRIMAPPQNTDEFRKQAMAAFLQGGGAGIYGDFLFGDTNRYGGGLAETFGGPSIGAFADLYRMKSELQDATKAHDFTRIKADAVRTIKNNLPFQNFLWTKAAMDYLVFYGLQESVNPGYLRRMEQRQRDQNQTTYIFPPSQFAHRF